ncbi:MAG: ABC transporter permease [Pseudomonadota bacterium]
MSAAEEFDEFDDGIIEPASDHVDVDKPAPIVPSAGVAGRALTFVVAAMCFLACISFAITVTAQRAASSWSSEVAQEATIQILPADDRDMDADIERAQALAATIQGVESVRVLPAGDVQSMLSPWLGENFDIDVLPVPRLVALRINPTNPPDFSAFQATLAEELPTANIDNHSFWSDRLSRGAQTIVIGAALLFILVNAVMIATVVFATRGAMSGNKEVIEVLHFVGAPHGFIANEFQRHFLVLGLKAGVIGGAASLVTLFVVSGLLSGWVATQHADTARFLTGQFSVELTTITGVILIVALVAGLTAFTTRATVLRYLHAIQ